MAKDFLIDVEIYKNGTIVEFKSNYDSDDVKFFVVIKRPAVGIEEKQFNDFFSADDYFKKVTKD